MYEIKLNLPNINGKHKDKTIITNIPYAILNICLISDILQKYHHFPFMFGMVNEKLNGLENNIELL